jgi:hypothetical protein
MLIQITIYNREMGNKTSKIGSSVPPKQPIITSKPLTYRNNINMQVYNAEREIVNPDATPFYEDSSTVSIVNSIILNIIDLIPINASKMSNKELDRRIEEEYRKKYPGTANRNRLATTLYQYHGKQVPTEALTIKDHVKKTIKIIINTYNRLRNSDSRDTNYKPFTIEQIVLKQSMFKKITYSSLHRPLTYAFLNEFAINGKSTQPYYVIEQAVKDLVRTTFDQKHPRTLCINNEFIPWPNISKSSNIIKLPLTNLFSKITSKNSILFDPILTLLNQAFYGDLFGLYQGNAAGPFLVPFTFPLADIGQVFMKPKFKPFKQSYGKIYVNKTDAICILPRLFAILRDYDVYARLGRALNGTVDITDIGVNKDYEGVVVDAYFISYLYLNPDKKSYYGTFSVNFREIKSTATQRFTEDEINFIIKTEQEKYRTPPTNSITTSVITGTPFDNTYMPTYEQLLKQYIRQGATKTSVIQQIDRRNRNSIHELLSANINVNNTNNEGRTALMTAVNSGDINITRSIIDKRPNTTKRNSRGKTALIHAIEKGNLEIFNRLVFDNSEGNTLNIPDHRNMTPLMYAIEKGNAEIVRRLLLLDVKLTGAEQTVINTLADSFRKRKIQRLLSAYQQTHLNNSANIAGVGTLQQVRAMSRVRGGKTKRNRRS